MINKSKVRQTALNLIYAIEVNGGSAHAVDLNLFWSIAQEKELDHYRLALAKALIHTTRASADTAALLQSKADAALFTMQNHLPMAKLADGIERIRNSSAEFEAAVKALKYSLKDKRRDGTAQLGICCNNVINLAGVIEGLCQEITPSFADFPELRKELQQLEAAINRRTKTLCLCAELRHPQNLSDRPEFINLVRCANTLQELRPEVEKLALGVVAHRQTLEAEIDKHLVNYSLPRIDTVDKCLLMLALYELKINKLDTPIVVSEVTALAHDYSGGKSAPFIHGIISAAAAATHP